MSQSITIKTTNINSKILYAEINQFIEEGINDIGVRWANDTHRESFVEIIEEWLLEYAVKGKITQFNVICDKRNNLAKELANGNVIFDIEYKQTNCCNTTKIKYIITEKAGYPLEDIIDYMLNP